jgi:hypothetical protein
MNFGLQRVKVEIITASNNQNSMGRPKSKQDNANGLY